jgi:hypothetical protein
MTTPSFPLQRTLLLALCLVACAGDEAPGPHDAPVPDGSAAVDPSVDTFDVVVPATGRVFVDLSSQATGADPTVPWDLAFEGYELFTNGGVSGGGAGWAFGPFDASTFDESSVPVAPITTPDKAAGAFLDWYFYEGAPAHVLWSRYHTLGVREGDRTWKVQVLGYYGERDGAPVSGLYRLRYAEITPGAAAEVVEVVGLDATAGGVSGGDDAPSECLDLASGARPMLSPAAAATDTSWHLCFRRQTITVNGGSSGPRGVSAVDLQAADTDAETLVDVKARTADTARAAFETTTLSSFATETFAPDRVVSGFGDDWVTRAGPLPAPTPATWIVRSADGQSTFLLRFSSFTGASADSPGRIALQTKVFTP